ncbi:MAG: TonB-dependent receptor [Bacteroidales bacterium]
MNKNYLFKHEKSGIRYLIFTLLALILNVGVYGQEITVSGIITGADDNQPIIGCSVIIIGQNKGTVTDLNGFYTIKVNVGGVLKFSYVGMEPQSITVSKPKLDVKLKSSAIALDEVVAIGYGTVKKKELTGAVAQIKSEDIANSVTSDLGNALQGKISGVNIISNSGAPGESSEILIRGITSVSGGNTPLFVVDGVPQEGDPRIGTNEIETIDVLKDAASCAIYGTRGAAGVILITTKQGKAGQLKLSIDANYGVQHITSSLQLMNSEEQTYFDIVSTRNLSNTPDDQMVLNIQRYTKGFQNNTNIGDVVFKDLAPTQNYSINISGGTKEISYNVVGGFYKTDGVVINSGFDRFNTRANTTYKSGKWQIGASLGLTSEMIEKSPAGIITQAIKYYPTQDAFDPNNNNSLVTFGGDALNRLNYVVESLKSHDNLNRTTSLANFNVRYNLSKTLSISSRLGTNFVNDYEKAYYVYQETRDVNGNLVGNPTNGYVSMKSARRTSFSWDGGLNYQKSFKNQKITAFLGYSLEEYTYDTFTAKKTGLLTNTINVLDAATLDQSASSGNSNYDNSLIGLIGRVQYDYKSKYLFSATMRRDGSSKFAKENRYGYFPSASAAWNVSDENFWKPLKDVANSFKLRASYGTTGNQSFSPYSYSSSITSGIDELYGSDATNVTGYGSVQTGFANALVKWETSIQSNFGFDLAMFNNKLSITGELYNTNKKDMLFPIILPGSAGGGKNASVTLNVGDMTNKGVELSMGYRTKTGQVNWDFSGTFSTNSNVITKINGLGGFTYTNDYGLINGATAQSQVTVLTEGHEAGAFYLYPTDGIADTHEKLANFQKIKPTARMGDLIYVDTNKDGVISDADRVYSGSGLPKYELGFNVKADYKGFDISVQLYSALGHKIMNGAKATAFTYGRAKDLLYAWSEANPVTSIPAYYGDLKSSSTNYMGYTTQWLEDGSYLRFKTITLGYNIPSKIIKKFGLSKLRVYLTSQNPITITKYTGYDPEIGGGVASRGLDKGNYPVTSLYSAGLNINF